MAVRSLFVGLAVAVAGTIAAAPAEAAAPPGCSMSQDYYYSVSAFCGANAQPRWWRLVVECWSPDGQFVRFVYGSAVYWYGWSDASCYPSYAANPYIQYLS